MDIAELEKLVGLLKDANVSELTLRQEGARVTIRKTPEVAQEFVAEVSGVEPEQWEDAGESASATNSDFEEITAPVVGFFRHVKPMVGVGANVKQGQTVGVIEAMKIVSDVISPVSGVIEDVYVEDGMPVEYGHLLFTLASA